MFALLSSRRNRSWLLQALFLLFIIVTVVSVILIGKHNLSEQGVSVGWGFLNYSTGWTISFASLPYDSSDTYAWALLVGLVNTIVLGVISISLALILGTMIGAARLSGHKIINYMAATYVQIVRNLPLILQGFFWYGMLTHLPPPRLAMSFMDSVYLSNRGVFLPGINVSGVFLAVAVVLAVVGIFIGFICIKRHRKIVGSLVCLLGFAISLGILYSAKLPNLPLLDVPAPSGLSFKGGVVLSPEFSAAIITISLFGAAYIAEVVRAGFLAVPHGLTEAGNALGMSSSQIFFKIRLPLMVRIILPTMTNQIIWLMKATTIGVAIGFTDFFAVISGSINHAGQTISLILILIMGFWAINLSISFIMNRVNRAIAIPGLKK